MKFLFALEDFGLQFHTDSSFGSPLIFMQTSMTKRDLDFSVLVYFGAAVIMHFGSVNAHYKCADYPTEHSSEFYITCDVGKVIIVESAIIGESDQYKANDTMRQPSECPITSSTCTKKIMFPAEICTGRKSCNISQRQQLPYDESDHLCPQSNYIGISYSCITPEPSIYGDICHFDGILYGNSSVYISSYPNFPNDMGDTSAIRCNCMLARDSESSVDVSVRALLVKLSANNACSDKLTIDSGGENERTFCSPITSINDTTTVSLTPTKPTMIVFERGSSVNPNNGKFLLEITGLALKDRTSSSFGRIKCGHSESTFSTSPTVTSPSPLYNISSTSTSNLVSPTSKRDQINFLGATLSSSIPPVSMQEKTRSSKSREASSKSTLEDFETNTVPLISSSVYIKNASLSTGSIVGIVLGVFAFITLVTVSVFFIVKKFRSKINARKHERNLGQPYVNWNPDYENTEVEMHIPGPITSNRMTSPNMFANQGPTVEESVDHAYSNDNHSDNTGGPDDDNQYERLRNNQEQHAYYNQSPPENNYQPLQLF